MSKLSSDFKRWRELRLRDLIDEGLDIELARTWAHREARARQSGERLIGKEAALSADLIICIHPNGRYSMYLKLMTDDVPSDLRAGAVAWANSSPRRDPFAASH